MASNERNFQLFTYVDDNAVSWNKRGALDTAINAIDGSAAFGAHPNWGRETTRHSTRKAIFQDPTTFRTVRIVVYTPTAFAAITPGTTTLAINVPGLATTVTYTCTKKVAERQPAAAGTRQLADHP